MRTIYLDFDSKDALRIKEIESVTNHDVKAVEYFIKEALNEVYLPMFEDVVAKIDSLAKEWANIPLLARTHGQPASPTRLGKELDVFTERLLQQVKFLKEIPNGAKFGGATGNYNAHYVAYPSINWKNFGTDFVEKKLGLHHSFPTTQIEHYDHMAAQFDALKRINNIILDLSLIHI